MALVYAGAYTVMGLQVALPFFLVASIVLAITVLYDMRHMVIPHALSVVLGVLSLATFFLTPMDAGSRAMTLFSSGICGLLFFALHICSRGRAMGLADTPLVMSLALLAGTRLFQDLFFRFGLAHLLG